MLKRLELFEKYSRKDVHDIFEPSTNFTSGTGTWGIQGIVKINNAYKDYVFFVTFGRSQAGHAFVEEVYEDGSITWQTQPSMDLNNQRVIDFINHDCYIDNIFLFLRTNGDSDYTYLGPLMYISHDREKVKPVYFIWKIIEFDAAKINSALPRLIIKHSYHNSGATFKESSILGKLVLDSTPLNPRKREGVSSSNFALRNVDFEGEAAKNTVIGNAGEDKVVEYEKERLTKAGRSDLAAMVTTTRRTISNAARYDVHSYEEDGRARYIEVKTTTGAKIVDFIFQRERLLFQKNIRQIIIYIGFIILIMKLETVSFIFQRGLLTETHLFQQTTFYNTRCLF